MEYPASGAGPTVTAKVGLLQAKAFGSFSATFLSGEDLRTYQVPPFVVILQLLHQSNTWITWPLELLMTGISDISGKLVGAAVASLSFPQNQRLCLMLRPDITNSYKFKRIHSHPFIHWDLVFREWILDKPKADALCLLQAVRRTQYLTRIDSQRKNICVWHVYVYIYNESSLSTL